MFEYCGLRGFGLHTHLFNTTTSSKLLLQLGVLHCELSSPTSQRVVLCLETFVLGLDLREQDLQLVHALLLAVARGLGGDAVLQLPSHEPFVWTEVCESLPFLRLSVDPQPLGDGQGERGSHGGQRSAHHNAPCRQRGDHNGLGRYHCHLYSSLNIPANFLK